LKISHLRIKLSDFSYSSSISFPKIISESPLNIENFSSNQSSIIVLEDVSTSFSPQDFNLQDEQPNQFSSPLSSINKQGRFNQFLFLNDYYFYVYPPKSNQIEIKTTYEPKKSFSFLILVFFNFFSSVTSKSFQSRIHFDQTHQSVFVQYPNNLEKILKIRIDISGFVLGFSSIQSSPSSNISSPNKISSNPSLLQNSNFSTESIASKLKSSIPLSSPNENVSDKPVAQIDKSSSKSPFNQSEDSPPTHSQDKITSFDSHSENEIPSFHSSIEKHPSSHISSFLNEELSIPSLKLKEIYSKLKTDNFDRSFSTPTMF
jgi:hypothetical protein